MTVTEREREAETQAEREAGSTQELYVGLNAGSPGSPGLKAALNHWATQAALSVFFLMWKDTVALGGHLIILFFSRYLSTVGDASYVNCMCVFKVPWSVALQIMLACKISYPVMLLLIP